VGQPSIASRAAVVAIGLNLVLNLALVAPLGESGLALSTSITSTLQLIWMWSRLSRVVKDDRATLHMTLRSLFLSVTASGAMGLACLLLLDLVGEGEGLLLKTLSLLFLVTAGVAVYGAVSLALPGDEARQVLRSLKRRPPGPS
jgi:putative peptidoglycan lipid II flippase